MQICVNLCTYVYMYVGRHMHFFAHKYTYHTHI